MENYGDKKMYIGYYKNNKVNIKIEANETEITDISFIQNNSETEEQEKESQMIKQCKEELEKYFRGELKHFKIKYHTQGTEFQEKVWKELLNVKYGTTISYKELAKRIGKPTAIRAVANAVGKNKIGIIIPCHRIIGSNGTLTGYAGGLENKKYLLGIERND